MLKRYSYGDFAIYQRATRRSGGTTVRWYGDFRSLGGGQKALTPRLLGETAPHRGVEGQREARRIATEYARSLRQGGGLSTGVNGSRQVLTVQEYTERHMAALRDRPKRSGQSRSESYLSDTEAQLRYAAEYFGPARPAASVQHSEVSDYLDHLYRRQLSPRTIEVYLRRLDQMFRRAAAERIIQANPVDAVRTEIPTGRRTRQREALESEQAWKLLVVAEEYDAATGHYVYPLASLLLHSGLRWSEARALCVGDIRFATRDGGPEERGGTLSADGVIVVEPNRWRDLKTEGAQREVPLWPDVASVLGGFVASRHPDAPLFPSPVRADDPVRNVRRAWAKVRQRAGLPDWVDFHTCRHTYASTRIQTTEGGSAISPYTVARELGHRSTAMVEQRYGHLLRDRTVRRNVVSYRPVPKIDGEGSEGAA